MTDLASVRAWGSVPAGQAIGPTEPFCLWLAYAREMDFPWCVVIVARHGREMSVQADLARAGWSTYLPMQRIWKGGGPRRRRACVPLFSRYLFAFPNAGGDIAAPTNIDGIETVRRPGEARSAIRSHLIARLMIAEISHTFDLTREKARASMHKFICGQPVRVRVGAMDGFEGLIERVLSEREVIVRLPRGAGLLSQVRCTADDLEAAA